MFSVNLQYHFLCSITSFVSASLQNSWIPEIRDQLRRVLEEHGNLVTVFDFDSDEHQHQLDQALLEAVFNSKIFQDLNRTEN